MRRTVLSSFVLALFLAAPVLAGLNFWSPIGPDGGEILSLAADPQRSEVLYAGTAGGVYKSVDGGATWRRASRGLRDAQVLALAVAPSDSAIVYAGTGFGVFSSRDGGATWQRSRGLPPLQSILSLAVDPRDPGRVWAGGGSFLFRTRDAGEHWERVEVENLLRVTAIAIDPVRPDTLYLAAAKLGEDGIEGILKSTDGGATWQPRNTGLGNVFFFEGRVGLAIDPTAPDIVYVSEQFGPGEDLVGRTYRSADGAATWQLTPGGYPLAVDPNGVVYAGDRRGTDHGATWETVAAPPRPRLYLASVNGDGRVWAGTAYDGIFQSRDRAATWQSSTIGLHATTVTSIAIDPERPRVIYAGTGGAGVLKTLSAGERWRRADAGLPATARGFAPFHLLALDPHQPQTVYLAWTRGFARSDDGGVSWTVLREGPYALPTDLIADPFMPGVVYLAGSNVGTAAQPCRLARSHDRGETFHCLPPFEGSVGLAPEIRLVADPVTPGTLWVLETRDRLWKTTNRGDNWRPIRPRGLAAAGEPTALLIDRTHPGRLYLGTARRRPGDRPERIWRSDNGGRSWHPWGSGMPEASLIVDLLMDPEKPSLFYAAVEHFAPAGFGEDLSGVYRSTDRGRFFTPLRDGLPATAVLRLVQSPKDPRKLYAATRAHGVYTFTRP